MLTIAALLPGCATITGVVTGAFTGFVDLPSEIIHKNQLKPDSADTWMVAIFTAPVGFVLGPAFGFVKGIALDVSAVSGALSVGEEFGTYQRVSVWRPYSYNWKTDLH